MTPTEPEIIWRGRRYWTSQPLSFEHLGWNTGFVPYCVIKETAHRITVRAADGDTLQFARKDWESKDKIYHSKHHEYFYKVKPTVDPEAPNSERRGFQDADEFTRYFIEARGVSPLSALGLRTGATKAEIKKAYKRLALKAHPDGGGSHEAFLKLNQAYERAMAEV